MKLIFRLIGFVVVIVILVMAVLCYLDSKGLLNGKLERLISVLRRLGKEAWAEIMLFLSDSGIANDAADLLEQGAEYFREGVTPHATERPGSNAFPEGYLTPTPILTTPEPTPTMQPTITPNIVTFS